MTFDMDQYLREVLSLAPERPYAEIAQLASVASASPAQHREAFSALLARKIEPLCGWVISPEVKEGHAADLERIAKDLTDQPDAYYTSKNDVMIKDLALAVGLLVGTRYAVLANSGVPRSWMLRGGVTAWPGNLAVLGSVFGFDSFLEVHMHERSQRVTATTWQRIIVMCAGLMNLNRSIRGLMGSSWFFDPNVATVSPHLGYLHGFPAAGGAKFFNLGTSAQAVALATTASKARRALYDEGKYLPIHFGFVWPRHQVIAWARAESKAA